MDRIFLDANILFSAAYRVDARFRELWSSGIELVSSAYAVEEARRNLEPTQREDSERLLESVQIIQTTRPLARELTVDLPKKDHPILAAAIDAKVTHLLTGDVKHFDAFYGQRVEGVLILRPAVYLQTKS